MNTTPPPSTSAPPEPLKSGPPPRPTTASGQKPGNNILNNIYKMADVPVQAFQQFLNKFRFVADTNYRLGCQFAGEGLYRDAVFRLKVALWFDPQLARAWYVLGSCYYARGETAAALGALQTALRLNPEDEETIFMMAMINVKYLPENKRPNNMPQHIAIDYFDRMSDSYEFQQREMGYVGHVVLDDAVRAYVDVKQVNFRMLDLGCGTGLMGYMLADVAGHMTGVDFSRTMLDHAMHRKRKDGGDLYIRAILRDIRDYLHEVDRASFDLLTASHVFNFIGDLETVFSGAARVLKEGGLFAFQVEPYPHPGFGMLPGKGRFSHNDRYILALAEKNDFDILEVKKEDVYPNYPFDQYILKKKPTV